MWFARRTRDRSESLVMTSNSPCLGAALNDRAARWSPRRMPSPPGFGSKWTLPLSEVVSVKSRAPSNRKRSSASHINISATRRASESGTSSACWAAATSRSCIAFWSVVAASRSLRLACRAFIRSGLASSADEPSGGYNSSHNHASAIVGRPSRRWAMSRSLPSASRMAWNCGWMISRTDQPCAFTARLTVSTSQALSSVTKVSTVWPPASQPSCSSDGVCTSRCDSPGARRYASWRWYSSDRTIC